MNDLLDAWFGPLDADGLPDAAHQRQWFTKDEAFDDRLRARFGALVEEAHAGGCRDWLGTPAGRVAYVVAIDQLSRNLFRGDPRSFAADPLALAVSVAAIVDGEHLRVPAAHAYFLVMPTMHSEDLAEQERCVATFAALRDGAPPAARSMFENAWRFAVAHRDIVARFGRFPHRNEVLGRVSTAEEVAFLAGPGSRF